MFFQVASEQASIQPETIFLVRSWPVTNAMLMGLLVTAIIFIVSIIITYRSKILPSKFQTVIEIMVEGFFHLVTQITGSDGTGRKLLPLIGAIFVFFGMSNLIGLVPGLTSLTFDGVSFLRTPTNDFNMTFSIALSMVLLTQIASIRHFGVFGHLGKYFKLKELIAGFRQGIGAGAIAFIEFLIGLLDIVSEVAKVISLSLRLFGNMYAGEVLAAILLGAFALAIPSVWLVMNLLVAVIQALVFGALTAAYFQLAVADSETQ
ncbi:MAG: hypothetical protein COU35_02945 [Candidatus Magasanikbacteria bacterium CG10_big_fil_rev_8_21_14_0_10_47_10]|uniref:ATP synthase subunit a n=1 Tax=Candidatus Magasanikbacteria bacterium CG10_big_fil_rev_8_21_14_0_10_47_10 TaxID=1974652 RepID=A0A2H0TQF1_9BACT|nr:MAG: hypothetical protein COU35_02945 [Candidatus Magasanikbacteria bacterium CG10_big_fil_rev_8_21_14_0_10_47_10]